MEIHKANEMFKSENRRWEQNADFVRNIMALMVNLTPRGKGAKIYTGQDFIKLSSDKVETKEERKPITPKEMKEKFGTKFNKNG